jgi:UDP-N-acetylmuramoylalanine--D-glutamate ligase
MGDYKQLAFLGLGISNRAAIAAMESRGVTCLKWDDTALDDAGMTELEPDVLKACDALIVSPGIAPTHKTVQSAKALGIPVMCDVELWSHFYPDAKTIGVTGTNGKSTVTAMICHILNSAGISAQMGGNIGKAVFELSPDEAEWIVLELSSFQIEYCPRFRPRIAALLNLSPDHLDRHGDMDGYAEVKARILNGAQECVIAVDDEWTRAIAGCCPATQVSGGGIPRTQNEVVALAVAGIAGVDAQTAQRALSSYTPLPHRQRLVRVLDGVQYINDSKATNVDAAKAALLSFENIIWIVGGYAKTGGLEGLEDCLQCVGQALVIGADMEGVSQWLEQNGVAHHPCGTIAAAVKYAYHAAKDGDTVLLSPACASYDQYRNFEERGKDFEAQVGAL